MKDWSRRHVLRATAGAAIAVPMAALGGGLAAASGTGDAARRLRSAVVGGRRRPRIAGPVMFCVHDAQRGEVSILHGTNEVIVHDRQLVARILQAAGCSPPPSRRKPEGQAMSSHREAPEISKDPVADNTDTYAFVSPDKPDTVTIISNYIPLEDPAGGPNFFEFGDDVLYRINIDNNGDGKADITYEFRFTTTIRNPETFLYNTGPIASLTDPNFNRPQTYTVTEVRRKPPPAARARTSRPRRATSAPARRRTTPTWPTRRSPRSATASRSSPASGWTGSTSTSAACSTSPCCGRSRICT